MALVAKVVTNGVVVAVVAEVVTNDVVFIGVMMAAVFRDVVMMVASSVDLVLFVVMLSKVRFFCPPRCFQPPIFSYRLLPSSSSFFILVSLLGSLH